MKSYHVQSKWVEYPIRVRYQETDQMRVVYHAHYVNWFEWGRTELIRAAGLSYREMEDRGFMLPVTDVNVQYILPAHYDDEIVIRTRLQAYSPYRIAFEYEIMREETILAKGDTKHIWLNGEWKPIRLDRAAPDVFAILQRIAAGDENQGG